MLIGFILVISHLLLSLTTGPLYCVHNYHLSLFRAAISNACTLCAPIPGFLGLQFIQTFSGIQAVVQAAVCGDVEISF